jgi:hypothetical protein
MPHRRHCLERSLAKAVGVNRHCSPREQPQPAFGHSVGDYRARSIVPCEQSRHRQLSADQALRDLDQKARAIATLAIGVKAAAMGKSGKG